MMQANEIKTCVFDNPATFSRECWQDGKLIAAYSAQILPPFAKVATIPPRCFFFGANVGEWKNGQIIGDKDALLRVGGNNDSH